MNDFLLHLFNNAINTTYFINLILIITSILLGICSARIAYFIDFCFDEGNILDFYLKYITLKVKPWSKKIWKLIGGCNICFGTSIISIPLFVVYYFVFGLGNIWLFIPYIATSTHHLLKLNKVF